jgi:hypothetical protein
MVQTVRVHVCTQRVEGYIEKKCHCRKFVPVKEATDMVALGDAEWTILAIKFIEHKVDCSLCGGQDPYVRSCIACVKQGFVIFKEPYTINGSDIYCPAAMKTPRTPTIEESHIMRQFAQETDLNKAYSFIKEAKERIRIYGILNKMNLAELGAELRDTENGDILSDGNPEPVDNKATGAGRLYDYGRPV